MNMTTYSIKCHFFFQSFDVNYLLLNPSSQNVICTISFNDKSTFMRQWTFEKRFTDRKWLCLWVFWWSGIMPSRILHTKRKFKCFISSWNDWINNFFILPSIHFCKSDDLNYHFQTKIVWADEQLCSTHLDYHFSVNPFFKVLWMACAFR